MSRTQQSCTSSVVAAGLLAAALLVFPVASPASAQSGTAGLPVTIEIHAAVAGGGSVYIAVFDSPEAFRTERPRQGIILDAEAEAATLYWPLVLPEGDYVISVFQDRNGNEKLDKNLLGLPREPIGLSNYDGKGIPGGFNSLKIRVDRAGQKIFIELLNL